MWCATPWWPASWTPTTPWAARAPRPGAMQTEPRVIHRQEPTMSLPELSLSLQFARFPEAAAHRAALPRAQVARWIRHALQQPGEITVRIGGRTRGPRAEQAAAGPLRPPAGAWRPACLWLRPRDP